MGSTVSTDAPPANDQAQTRALELLAQLLDDNRDQLKDGVLAADIGQRWRYKFPTERWEDAFLKLGHMLAAFVQSAPERKIELLHVGTPRLMLRERTLASTRHNVEPAQQDATRPASGGWVARPSRQFDIRREVYEAVVHEGEPPLFIDPQSFDISRSPEPPVGMLRVDPVTQEKQRGWALTFLEEHELSGDADLLRSLEQRPWFIAFADALQHKSATVASAWRAYRSSRVFAHLQEWCKRHYIPMSVLGDRGHEAEPARREVTREVQDAIMRDVVLEAIRRMDTPDMLEIPIPARLLFDAIRPLLPRPLRGRDDRG